MTKFFPWLVFLALASLAAELAPPPPSSVVANGNRNQVVAIINEEVVTLMEILRTMPGKKPDLVSETEWLQYRFQQFRERLDVVKERKLLFQEARLATLEIPSVNIDAETERRWKRLFDSKDKYLVYLKRMNMTQRQFQNEIMEDMMARAVIGRRVEMRFTTSPRELLVYYREHSEEFTVDESRELRLIQIPIRLESGESPVILAASISKKAREDPKTFEALAKKYSVGPGAAEGGYWGWKKPDDMRDDLSAAAFRLKKGQVSDVVATSIGYFIIEVDNIKAGQVQLFEKAQAFIRRKIQNERFQKDRRKLLDDLLKRAYVVEFLPDPQLLR